MKDKEIKGYLALIGSSLSFSLMTVCVKNLNGRIPVAEIVLIRGLISILATRFMMYRREIEPWGFNKKLLFTRGILGTLALLCIFKALTDLPLATATVIQYTYPIHTALIGSLLLKEIVSAQILKAIIVGLAGVALVIQPYWNNNQIAHIQVESFIIGFAGALLTALAYICVRKLSESEDNLVIVFYFPLVSIPITIPFVISQGVIPSANECLWLIGIGLLTQLGQLWLTNGFAVLPAAKASSINYTQVLFAGIWGVIIFDERINFIMVIGSALILWATVLTNDGRRGNIKSSNLNLEKIPKG